MCWHGNYTQANKTTCRTTLTTEMMHKKITHPAHVHNSHITHITHITDTVTLAVPRCSRTHLKSHMTYIGFVMYTLCNSVIWTLCHRWKLALNVWSDIQLCWSIKWWKSMCVELKCKREERWYDFFVVSVLQTMCNSIQICMRAF